MGIFFSMAYALVQLIILNYVKNSENLQQNVDKIEKNENLLSLEKSEAQNL